MSERAEDTAATSARPPAAAVRGLWPLYVGTFFLAAAGGLVFPLLAELQDVHDLPTWGLGLISGLFFVGAVVGQLVFAPLGDRGRARILLLLGVGLSLVSLGWFAFATQLWEFGVARALSGLAAGMYLPAARASLVRADPARTGLLLGRFAGTETGGFIFGPVLGTAIYQVLGLQAPFLLVTVVLAVVLVVLARVEIPGTRTAPGHARPVASHPTGSAGRSVPPPAPPRRAWSPCSSSSPSSSRSASTTPSGPATSRTGAPRRCSSGWASASTGCPSCSPHPGVGASPTASDRCVPRPSGCSSWYRPLPSTASSRHLSSSLRSLWSRPSGRRSPSRVCRRPWPAPALANG